MNLRTVRAVLAAFLILIFVFDPVLALSGARAAPASLADPIKEYQTSPGLASQQNTFLRVDAKAATGTESGTFVVGTTGGDPTTTNDDHHRLLFGYGRDGASSPGTSFTSVRIQTGATTRDQGLHAIAPTAVASVSGDTIVTTWTVSNVRVEQRLSLVNNSFTGRPDTTKIEYVVTNADTQTHNVGVRVMLDVQIGDNDGAPYFVPGLGNLTTEKEFLGTAIPTYWRAFEDRSFSAASLKGQGILKGDDATAPDRFVIARWQALKNTTWDYTVNTSSSFTDDSATALYWNPTALAPGQSRRVVTYYGLAGAGGGTNWLDGPATLTCGQFEFDVTHWVVNGTTQTLAGGQTTLTLPAGISLAAGEDAAKTFRGDVPPGQSRSATWRLVAGPVEQATTKTVSARATFSGIDPLTAGKEISIPACEPTGTGSLNVAFLGFLEDRVGSGERMLPDGSMDGTFNLEVRRSGAHRITFFELRAQSGVHIWDTAPNNVWVLGVAEGSAGATLLNRTDTSVDISMTDSKSLRLFAADDASLRSGGSFALKVCFDGSGTDCATATIVVGSGSTATTRSLGPQKVTAIGKTWAGVHWANRPLLPTCGTQAVITTEVDIYGDAPASVVIKDDRGRTLGTMSLVSSFNGGGHYRGTGISNWIPTEAVPQLITIFKEVTWADGATLTDGIATHKVRCIDPSGYVFNSSTSARVPGATVTLYNKDPQAGDIVWNAAEYEQINPQITDNEGRYGWQTPPGDFYVKIGSACYAGVQSRTVTVPPEVTDLNIGLTAVGCSPVKVISAQVLDPQSAPVTQALPGNTVRLEALINNSGATAVTVDVALLLTDARGRTVTSLSQTGMRTINPGDNRITLEGALPTNPEGEYALGVTATHNQQSTYAGAGFKVSLFNVYVPVARNGHVDPTFGGAWRAGLQVLNLDNTRSANVHIHFVRPDGSEAALTPARAIAGGKSETFFGSSIGVAEGFNGSAIVSADRPIAVIVNQLAQDTGLSGSFNGIAAAGTKSYVPIALRNADGTSTSIYIQNAGASPTTRVTVKLTRLDQSTPAAIKTITTPIKPGAAYELTQASLSELGDAFRGAAVVEADQPVAVVVNQSNRRSLLASTGQIFGTSTLYGPLVMNNNGGFNSSVQVQNTGSASTQITVKLVSSATGAQVATQTRGIAGGAATSWTITELLGNNDRFVGSVTVQAASGGSIIGIVNQVNVTSNQATSYSLFAGGTASVVAPLVQTSNSGWTSGFQVQNVGGAPVTVTVTVTDTAGNMIGSVPDPTRTIASGKSETWYPITGLGTRMIGSATATGSSGALLVGVVNQLNQESGAVDYFTTYEAINQ